MKVNYQYASPSKCIQKGSETTLGLSPDLSREEKVSFLGKLKNPLIFRDSMLMLRQIVISDSSQKKKDRTEFFDWLNREIERRIEEQKKYLPEIRDNLTKNINNILNQLENKNKEINNLLNIKKGLQKEIDSTDAWKDYYTLERKFWKFIKDRDYNLWFVLDPVITVHKDQVSFEAFSIDESTYGCLSIAMNEFEMLKEPKLGTTNIDFSAKLEKEIERFRTYTNVTLSVNPEGFTVDNNIMPEHVEKKIDLPETWIKGFNQVSSAASLGGIDITISPADMYDICSFLRKHKEKHSPRYMKWILEPDKPVKILFQPFGAIITLNTIYKGNKIREEKIWGRRRWLILEKLIPIADSFKIRLLGFGMPQFICADMGTMKMTVGFSSWSSNDWVKGTAFNVMNGFIGEGNYKDVYKLMKKERCISLKEIENKLNAKSSITKSGVGMLLKKGEGFFDIINNKIRFRQLCNTEIPEYLYETTEIEKQVGGLIDSITASLKIIRNKKNEFTFTGFYKSSNYSDNTDKILLTFDEDGQIVNLGCNCHTFNKGARNISEPCAHILAMYIVSIKFLKLDLKYDKEYKINDIMEMLL